MQDEGQEGYLRLRCIAPVEDAYRADPYCFRDTGIGLDFLMRGGQPLCHTHETKIETELQLIQFGQRELLVPTATEVHEYPEAWSRCAAYVITGDDLEGGDLDRCLQWAMWAKGGWGRQPLGVPLCTAHAMALLYALRWRWNSFQQASDLPRAGWGARLAADFGLPPPHASPY